MNEKGFIQIKVLTIFFIIGIICFTLVPRIFSYYSENKKEEYVSLAKKCIDKVKDSINSLEFKQLPKENEGLVVKVSNLGLKVKSPYGSLKNEYSYVIVINMGSYYDYYFAAMDSNYWGIPIVNEKELNTDSVVFGKTKLMNIDKVSSIDNLYISGTIFEASEESKQNDKNILLTPVTGELAVPYEFKAEVHKIYDKLIKSIDTDIYNREATINNGVLKYNNATIASNYSNDINGFFRYLSFPNDKAEKYYSSFVSYNKSYTSGIINASNDYNDSSIVFDSRPTVVMNDNAAVVNVEDKNYLMWNLMAIYPDNNNYTISECGALIVKGISKDINITFDTEGVMIGKSNNGCELGNIFAVRKNNVKSNDKFSARGYIKYKDKNGKEYISYSRDIIEGMVY